MYPTEQKPLWTPSPERIAAANVTAFRRAAERRWGVPLPDYEALHAWSVAQPERFWTSVWEGDGVGSGVIGTRGERVLVDGHRMPGAKWFPDARLNFAQNLLRSRDAHDAIVFWGEERVKNRMSHGELYRAVAHFAAALKEQAGGSSAHDLCAVENHAAGRRADSLGQAESRADHGLAEEIGVVLIAALSGLVAELEALLEGSKRVESVVRNESFCRAFACGNRASFELFHCYFASFVMISRISALV